MSFFARKEPAMKRFIAPLLAAASVLVVAPANAAPRLSPEARLAKALEGRVAGEPVDCINLRSIRSSRIIDETAILYEVGSTLYVNRPRAGQDSLDRWDTMVTKTFGSQLCSIDTIKMVDPSSHMLTGIVFLGDFVPYRKVR
jgi:hypothetical protein